MKKIKILLLGLVCALLIPIEANAASGSIGVSGSSTAVVGNKITITVTLSSGTSIGSWQMDLNYDKNYLQLTASTAEGGGTRMVNSSATGVKKKTYTFTFKALKSGSTRVSVSSYLAYAFVDMSEISLSDSSKSIKIMTQQELEATYSKDNNLKSLSVEGYELDKEFNKDTLEYIVNVPTGTKSVKIKATENDSKASVSGDGEVTVTEGLNTIPIVVTAQNGSSKTYTLTINVEDQNPINVTIDNKNYTVVKNEELLTAPLTFTDAKITINDIEIPAFTNTISDITLVGLKDEQGNIKLFVYNNGKYSKFNEMNLKSYLLIPVAFDKKLDLIKTSVTINGEEMEAYKYSEKSDFVIINAKNLEDGTTNLYLYDTKNNTASLYDETFINETNETLRNYTFVIVAFAGALLLMFIVIFSLLHSLKKKQKKINKFIEKQEAKIEATRKLNDVVKGVKKELEKEHHELKQDTTELKNKNEEKTKEEQKLKKEEKPKKEKLSKKERKKLKKEQEKQNKEQVKTEEKDPIENKSNDKVEIKEIQVKEEKLTPKEADIIQEELEKTEEMYDLFGEDKKKKKKKR